MKRERFFLHILSLALVFFGGGNISGRAQSAFQEAISSKGYDNVTCDYSDVAEFAIDEPSVAYVNISGISNMPDTKTANLHAWVEVYDGHGAFFKKRAILNAQGNSSMAFVKKNLGVDFCEDEWLGKQTPSISIGNWVSGDSWHLKAYYADYFRGVGAVGYKLYDRIQESSGRLWERADLTDPDPKARCYPDGFPAVVYLNGEFYGLFAWQLKKSAKNYNLSKNDVCHIHLDGALRQQDIWDGVINWRVFEVRTPKNLYIMDGGKYDGEAPKELMDETSDYYDLPTDKEKVKADKQKTAAVKHSIEALARLCPTLKEETHGATEAAIKAEVERYFDLPGMIDYCCFNYVVNNYDGFGKNQQWFTYDGQKWFLAPYDLDGIFGNFYTGTILFPPERDHWGPDYTYLDPTGPIYFMKRYYWDDIKSRYAQLRANGVFDPDNIKNAIRSWYDRFGSDNYDQEYAKWKDSYCISETVCNPNWTTEDDWTDYLVTPDYDNTRTYKSGDKCRLDCRIWTATGETTGVRPYLKMGYTDSFERIGHWIDRRIELLDEYLGYTAEGVGSLTAEAGADMPRSREVRAIYSASGLLRKRAEQGINIILYDDGTTRKIILK